MKVDSVVADIEAFVVNDNLLSTDVLIGQTLTELPSVVAHKTSQDLLLYTDESVLAKVKLYNTRDTYVKGTGLLEIHTDLNISGSIFVPECNCMKEQGEYLIMQGLYSLNKGHGYIIIVDLSKDGIQFQKIKLMSRARDFSALNSLVIDSTSVKEVNQVLKDTPSRHY